MKQTDPNLDAVAPDDARQHELRKSTIKSLRSRLGLFVKWCDRNDITALTELEGVHLHQYRVATGDEIAPKTLLSRLSSLRVFLEWAESIDAVTPGLHEKILLPNIDSPRDRVLEPDRATELLNHLQRFDYAARDHVIMRLLWRTGMRIGALRGLDVGDFHPDGGFLDLQHRPKTGTPLKNGREGERPVALSEQTRLVISDYLDHNRTAVTDEHGRDPLVTTRHGRPSITTLRRVVYRLTRPCVYTRDCPHERDPDTCDAAQRYDQASQCPSVVSPHDVRRGAITHMLREDVPEKAVSDRCDVSTDVLDKHYDQRTDQEKMEQRRGFLNNL